MPETIDDKRIHAACRGRQFLAHGNDAVMGPVNDPIGSVCGLRNSSSRNFVSTMFPWEIGVARGTR